MYVTICGNDPTPPVANIVAPAALACACGVVNVVRSAYDPDGAFHGYKLESAPAAGGTRSTIATGTMPVQGGSLGVWDTTGLTEGYYLLRLTSTNTCDLVNTAVRAVWLDQQINSVVLRAPAPEQVLGGTVCADGSVWDHCPPGDMLLQYRPIGGAFTNFGVINPPWVVNDPLGTWNTQTAPDGVYEIRVVGTDPCGHAASDTRIVTVDNTAPIAVITSPLPCTFAEGIVQVRGTTADAHMAGWLLQYSAGDAHGWVTIASGSPSVVDGVLGNWNTQGLCRCAYVLRLVATDRAQLDCSGALHNRAEYTVAVGVGSCCDLNADGLANGGDIQPFINCLLLGSCP